MVPPKKQNILSLIVFGVYLVLLAWLVLFKFSVNLSALPDLRRINLIPLYYDNETNTHAAEVIYNILIFVPLGVYIQIFREKWPLAAKCLVIILTSFLFEAVQFLFAIGASDITDLIGNTAGGLGGILFCMIMKKWLPEKFISVINTAGSILEIAGIGLLTLLLIANR